MYFASGRNAENPMVAKVREIRQNTPIGARLMTHRHFHHDIIELAEKICDGFRALAELGQNDTDDQRKDDDLQHFAIGEGLKRVVRKDVEQGL